MDKQTQYRYFCDLMLKFVNPTKQRILDVGCGDGGLVKYIAANYDPYEVIGLDPALETSYHMGDSIGCNWKILFGNAHALEFADNSFDFVISFSTFEHISNLVKALSEIKRVLKPHGKFYTSFEPIWTSIIGHHYLPQVDRNLTETSLLAIPPWGHLYMTEDEMCVHLTQGAIKSSAREHIIQSIYHSDRLNRMSRTNIIKAIMSCGMIVRSFGEIIAFNRLSAKFGRIPQRDTELTPAIIEKIVQTEYSYTDLGVTGMRVCLEKYLAI